MPLPLERWEGIVENKGEACEEGRGDTNCEHMLAIRVSFSLFPRLSLLRGGRGWERKREREGKRETEGKRDRETRIVSRCSQFVSPAPSSSWPPLSLLFPVPLSLPSLLLFLFFSLPHPSRPVHDLRACAHNSWSGGRGGGRGTRRGRGTHEL